MTASGFSFTYILFMNIEFVRYLKTVFYHLDSPFCLFPHIRIIIFFSNFFQFFNSFFSFCAEIAQCFRTPVTDCMVFVCKSFN